MGPNAKLRRLFDHALVSEIGHIPKRNPRSARAAVLVPADGVSREIGDAA